VGNSQNYRELFEDLLNAYQTMLNFSPYLGAMIDKYAGRYHQDISTIEK
jgi:proline dehydrogenase